MNTYFFIVALFCMLTANHQVKKIYSNFSFIGSKNVKTKRMKNRKNEIHKGKPMNMNEWQIFLNKVNACLLFVKKNVVWQNEKKLWRFFMLFFKWEKSENSKMFSASFFRSFWMCRWAWVFPIKVLINYVNSNAKGMKKSSLLIFDCFLSTFCSAANKCR